MQTQPRLGVILLALCALGSLSGAGRQAGQTPRPPQNPVESSRVDYRRFDREAKAAYAEGDFAKAAIGFQKCLEVVETLGNEHDIMTTLNNLGATYNYLGELDKALEYYNRSSVISQKVGNQQDIADSLLNRGILYDNLGQYDSALDFDNQSMAKFKELGNQSGIADSLNSLGVTFDHLGKLEKTLAYYIRSLAIRKKLHNPSDIAASLNNLGAAYHALGQLDKALDYGNQALAVRRQLANQRDIAMSLSNLGVVYYDLGQFDKALDFNLQALSHLETVGNQQLKASCLNNLGTAYQALGQFDKARDRYNESLVIKESLGNLREIADSLANLGSVCDDLSQFDMAIDYYKQSLAMFQRLGNQQNVATELYNVGVAYDGLRQLDNAAEAYDRAEHAFEEVSLQVGDPSKVGSFQAANEGSLYVRYARTLARENKLRLAIEQLERGRAQGLARQVEFNERGLSQIFSGEDSKRLIDSHIAAIAASKLMQSAKGNLEAAPESEREFFTRQVNEYGAKAAQTTRDYELIKDELYAKYPDFKNISGKKPPNAEELMELARHNPDSLFLEYGQSEDVLDVMSLHGRDAIGFHEIKVKATDLTRQVRAYLDSIPASESEEKRRAKQLYTILLGPLKIDPKTTKRIVFVPAGALQDLPLAALLGPDGKRLVERYSVSSTVSLGLLIGRSAKRRPSKGLLVVADPDGAGTSGFASNAFGTYGPLGGARAEGRSVAAIFPGATQLVGAQARESAVRNQAAQYSLLHFACHGYLNSKQAMESGLVMAPEPAASPDIGVLTASSVMGIRLSAQLAVLSACETGQGVQSGGEGLMGLTWAFRAAGCPAVVASKWDVDDAATKRIMVSFYKHLKAHKRKDDALRAAMLEEMHYPETHDGTRAASSKSASKGKPGRSNAYYWAAFQVIGDCQPLNTVPGS